MTREASSVTDVELPSASRDFVRQIVSEDEASGKHGGRVATRFPPEPNGYLHLGHAKSICLNFGIAGEFGGVCHLRFDDTNPAKEDQEYVDAIQRDVRWLGFDWGEHRYYASDYFGAMLDFARHLIREGLAYVCELSADDMRTWRGTPTEPGRNSPWRDRPVAENLDLFERMVAGGFDEGACTLRARIDMASPNLNMRDPAMYRIKRAHHHRTGDRYVVYPMYDYAHCVSDALERITHSICTLEFEDHRPLYDWFLDHLPVPAHPQQIEFARLNMTHVMMSKRKLLQLVQDGHVRGWDDPRMPTLSGIRRRGYSPSAVRAFCESIGVSKANSLVHYEHLEHFVRQDMNARARRVMAVLDPVRVVIENYPEGQVEWFEAENNPENPADGSRQVAFGREIWLEREDFSENPPPKWFRLAPGREIRLKHAYYITCREVVKDASGRITELRCTYDPESRGGGTPDGRVVRGTSHWVSVAHGVPAEVRLYDHLFAKPHCLDEGEDLAAAVNPDSLRTIEAILEPDAATLEPGTGVQFLRQGYFCVDPDSRPERPIYNRTVGLRDTWAKVSRS
ncbi:MAG: glutamine--tRNA ligase/YqeY domain fusion protein [Candidatus Sericytochromatia bacterium]|nr:glutamine--tRNA ligase/YqeY domain fusion protein [Candidatus Sericytochromatia bacterium]